VDAALNDRLERGGAAPIVVAFSGGGDSLALLLAAKAWADGAGRRLVAITIDHGLQAASEDWALWCQRRAERLDVEHRTQVWTGEKPKRGIAAAARAARHDLLADAARQIGAAVILIGHTADDRLETRVMRQWGARLSEPRAWSPSPAWPQGRGVFLLRPLLATRRAAIRDGLKQSGETWIEDPSNIDPAQPRSRARLLLAGDGALGPESLSASAAALFDDVEEGAAGDLMIASEVLADAPRGTARTFLGAALLCASGTATPPRGDRLDRLLGRIAAKEPFVATLAGARVQSDGRVVRIMREAGGYSRRAPPDVALPVGQTIVFDGRFELTARLPDLVARLARGRAGRLSQRERRLLKASPPAARLAAPLVAVADGSVFCPLFGPEADVQTRGLVMGRLAGACGAIWDEAAIRRVANASRTP
jgi:tRNA(Ile)-lysidine synthase